MENNELRKLLNEANRNNRIKIRFDSTKNEKRKAYLEHYENYKRNKRPIDVYFTGSKSEIMQAIKLAKEIRDHRTIELIENKEDFQLADKSSKINFHNYAFKYANSKNDKNKKSYIDAIRSFAKVIDENCTLSKIDDSLIRKWIDNNKRLSPYTIKRYSVNLKAVFNNAIKEGLVKKNPFDSIQIKYPVRDIKFLTEEELKILIGTEMKYQNIKNAFLFSCFTGLRLSEIIRLTWSDFNEKDSRIKIYQSKTDNIIYNKIDSNALMIINEQKHLKVNSKDRIFKLPTYKYLRINIRNWIESAKISKKITFHCARHTFATLMISNDVPVEVVKEYLGHHDISTTMIYAKITNKLKDIAIEKLPKILKENSYWRENVFK